MNLILVKYTTPAEAQCNYPYLMACYILTISIQLKSINKVYEPNININTGKKAPPLPEVVSKSVTNLKL